MSISSEITRLENAKASMINALEARGVDVPDGILIGEIAEYIGLLAMIGEDDGGVYLLSETASSLGYAKLGDLVLGG